MSKAQFRKVYGKTGRFVVSEGGTRCGLASKVHPVLESEQTNVNSETEEDEIVPPLGWHYNFRNLGKMPELKKEE